MKDSIDKRCIFNRKISVELRFSADPTIEDRKGEIIRSIAASGVMGDSCQWNFEPGVVKLWDNSNVSESRNQLSVSIKKVVFISSKIDSNQSFVDKVSKIIKAIFPDVKKGPTLLRIGCRIIGSYKAKSDSFDDVLKGFIRLFPNQLLFDDFVSKDLMFNLRYKNGMYSIGPVNKEDEFVNTNFPHATSVKEVGIAIDTDNFTAHVKQPLQIKNVNDVILASLSAEKELYERLKAV